VHAPAGTHMNILRSVLMLYMICSVLCVHTHIVPMIVSPSANCVLKLSKMSISPEPGQAPYLQADAQQYSDANTHMSELVVSVSTTKGCHRLVLQQQ
jgi:hypothetical protein